MIHSSGKRERASGSIARNRLETVLLADRLNCSPETVELMKRDILAVMDKYLACDQFDITVHLDIAAHVKQGGKHVKTVQIKGL
ncbi:MAG: cell division topological specificity factor MinE [Candidatus Limivivens sp.]|nr:cell division topological specificity factor MinE [Candidatus Limivivens sp.]